MPAAAEISSTAIVKRCATASIIRGMTGLRCAEVPACSSHKRFKWLCWNGRNTSSSMTAPRWRPPARTVSPTARRTGKGSPVMKLLSMLPMPSRSTLSTGISS